MNAADAFPYPVAEYGAEPYWQACNEERLVMQRCGACTRVRWHPAPLCVDCQHGGYEWVELSGRGTVYSFTVITHPVHPAAHARVPYIVVEVELQEQAGLRMISNLVDIDGNAVTIGMPVACRFVEHPGGQKLPVFGPA